MIDPLFPGLQFGFVVYNELISKDVGCEMITTLVAVQPLKSETQTV